MLVWVVVIFALFTVTVYAESSFAQESVYVDSVKFIQYIDENIALEEVRLGTLDIHYWAIPSDRLEGSDATAGLNVYNSTAGQYSLLVNPADTETFNPFADRDARFALNYLVDRKLFVNELMGGFGSPTLSPYGPSHPEYLLALEPSEKFGFVYNPSLANEMISKSMVSRGAVMSDDDDGMWVVDSSPVEITVFIRSDDPIRKSVGEIVSSELEDIGFKVNREYGDLNKAFAVVYGADPADFTWHIYTEGWGSTSFTRYDSINVGAMYAPWVSQMPGFNVPAYWNYEHDRLDEITQRIYTGNYSGESERAMFIKEAISEGISESVRIFLATRTDQYVTNQNTDGVINDFGAGIPTRFTPINARTDDGSLTIGVKHIYQGSWNTVAGLSDLYSIHIWSVLSDPSTFKHPYTGETMPVRAQYQVETAGPDGTLDIPPQAVIWDPSQQSWVNVSSDASATSKVTFDYAFSKWHHGQWMDMNDIMYSLYFLLEWGSEQGDENDKTFDSSYTPLASQFAKSIKGVNQIDDDTLEVYVDYWHFDNGEVASWASLWSNTPWEITAAMESAVLDGRVAFSQSVAQSKDVSWLSILVPNDAELLSEYLTQFADSEYVPITLVDFTDDTSYMQDRYDASVSWIQEKNHAVISNGPFYLESYNPEARAINLIAFNDESYPFEAGKWSEFEHVVFPQIEYVDVPVIVQKGNALEIEVGTQGSDSVVYFLTTGKGDAISGTIDVDVASGGNVAIISIPPEEIELLDVGAGNLKIFATSESVRKPDIYESSFLVVEAATTTTTVTDDDPISTTPPADNTVVSEPGDVTANVQQADSDLGMLLGAAIIGIIAIAVIVVVVIKKRK